MKSERGFTIIELMIVLLIMAILATLGVPSFNNFILDNRLATQVNDLVATLNVARSEAVKRNRSVTVCKSADNASCTTADAWDQGWIVFVDLDADGVVDTGEEVLQVHDGLIGGNSLQGSANVVDLITLSSQGFAVGFDGTFTLCDSRGAEKAKGIIVSNSGRVRRAVDSNSNGKEEDAAGNDLTC